jgi:uncharacterized glyoxalase superfamily protein PhnB
MRAAWSGFFNAFPSYRNVVTTVVEQEERIVLLGHSRCSEQALSGPAIWTAKIQGGRVAEWRVHDDDDDIRRSLSIRAGGLDSGTVISYLYYEDAGAALSWLMRVYGFVERAKETRRDEKGAVFHAAVNAGAGVILLGRPGGDYKNPKQLGQTTQNLYVYVVDLDRHFEHAKREGAQVLSEIEQTSYGDRRYGSADLEGHHWYFAEKGQSAGRSESDGN